MLSIDDELVRKVRKVAVERNTTLAGLIRVHLKKLAAERPKSAGKRLEREGLEYSFNQVQFRLGKKIWHREDLYVRS